MGNGEDTPDHDAWMLAQEGDPKGEGEREANSRVEYHYIDAFRALRGARTNIARARRAAEYAVSAEADERAAIVAWLTTYSNDMMHLDQNEGSMALMLAADAIRDGAHLNQKGQG